MSTTNLILRRGISTSCACHSLKNFRKFLLYNKRGSRVFKEERAKNPNYDIPIDTRGVRPTGFREGTTWVHVPEMVPELIVPSLKDFPLKPYVTYKATETKEIPEFTARELFEAVYVPKIQRDFVEKQLGLDGEPLHPSKEELLTAEEARLRAEQTGSDRFTEEVHFNYQYNS